MESALLLELASALALAPMPALRWAERPTFLLRQDLQFIVSRGSTVARRGVSRSMLTCGRDMGGGHGERKVEEEIRS